MFSELRSALRQLAKSPGFTGIALLTLALGIGLNAAMFNLVNSLVLQPLKFRESDSLFRLVCTSPGQQSSGYRPETFIQIAQASGEFAQLACLRPSSDTLVEPHQPPEILSSLRVSAGFFNLLGLQLEQGRDFRPDEDKPGRDHVVILSHACWQTHFNGAPDVVGRVIRLEGQPHEIIGVAPLMATDPRSIGSPEIYHPLALTTRELQERGDHGFGIIGRYRPGMTAAQAATRWSAITAGLAMSDPRDFAGRELHAISLKPELRGVYQQIVYMLIGLSSFVLLIACANLANLLLARAIAQAREFAIRGALGASQTQLLRPLALQCTLLAIAGGALGVLVCLWTNEWMGRQFSGTNAELVFVFDWRLLAFAFGVSLMTGLCFGVAPAWAISRVNINDTLKSGTRSATGAPSQNRFRQLLIVGQFALALVLLSGAVFFARGLDQILGRDAGWRPEHVLRGILALPASRYPDIQRMMQFYEKVQERVSTLPGVAATAISYEEPIFGFPAGNGFIVEGQPPPPPGHEAGAPVNGVTPGYFETIGTRLVRGRDFATTDGDGSPRVVILNETMARQLFPGTEALGHRVGILENNKTVWLKIVGIAADVHFLDYGNSNNAFQAYVPLAQATWSYVTLSVRVATAPQALAESIRKTVSELDPDLAIKELTPAPAFIQHKLQDAKAVNHLLVGFAVLGLLLAALGIYGVVERLIAQRTNEIGIRMALGAQTGNVIRLILNSGMRFAVQGMVLGLLGAAALAYFLHATVPALSASRPGSIAMATTVLLGVALIACYVPARRATKVDPMIALRAE